MLSLPTMQGRPSRRLAATTSCSLLTCLLVGAFFTSLHSPQAYAQTPTTTTSHHALWDDVSAWKRVKKGMTTAEVRTILGDPTSPATETAGMLTWTYGQVGTVDVDNTAHSLTGVVAFQAGKVVLSEFVEIPQNEHAVQQAPPPQSSDSRTQTPPAGFPGSMSLPNWNKVQSGMTPSQVQLLLGEPSTKQEGSFAFWQYNSRDVSTFGVSTLLGQVSYMDGKVVSVAPPTAEQLAKEREFWAAHGLDSDASQAPAAPVGWPLWADANRWLRVTPGMTRGEVVALLGEPSWNIGKDALVYFDWSYAAWKDDAGPGRDALMRGQVDLNVEGKVRAVRPLRPDAVAQFTKLVSLAKEESEQWPQWASPLAWASMRQGQSTEQVEMLLGSRDRTATVRSEIDDGKTLKRLVWTFGGQDLPVKTAAEVVFDGTEFAEVMLANAPDFRRIGEMVAKSKAERGGVAASTPLWSDPARWDRLDIQMAALAHAPPRYALKNSMYAPSSAKREGQPRVDWAPATGRYAGQWHADLVFENGGKIGVVTPYVMAEPHPTDDHVSGFLDEVSPPEGLRSTPKISAKQVASGDAKHVREAFLNWSNLRLQLEWSGEVGVRELRPTLQSLYDSLGTPQSSEWVEYPLKKPYSYKWDDQAQADLVTTTIEPVRAFVLHYGDGTVTVLTELDRHDTGSLPIDPKKHVRIISVKRPSGASLASAAGGQKWPQFGPQAQVPDAAGRPCYLDLTRYGRLDVGDSIAWVILVLGAPTSVDRGTGERDAGSATLMYGPFAGASERWYSGKVHVNSSGEVTGIEPPTKKN